MNDSGTVALTAASDRYLKRFMRNNAGMKLLKPLYKLSGAFMARELFYQSLFYQTAASLDLRLPALYPVQSAANYSLLYAILRAVTDLPVRSVLDIGAGQSTLLLDALRKRYPELVVTTLETNPSWAQLVGAKVGHPVHCVPLMRKPIHGRDTKGYADLGVLGDQRYDLVLVDGPPGGGIRYSRWGALEVLGRSLGEQFMVIFDDASRRGECDTVSAFVHSVSSRVRCWSLRSIKSQFFVFTPQFGAAEYF